MTETGGTKSKTQKQTVSVLFPDAVLQVLGKLGRGG